MDGTTTLEVPEYVDGKPGDLWVIRSSEGLLSVVSSIYEPGHAKWPGKVKGWPQPSLEYQREQWEMYRKHEESNVRLYENLLKELKSTPDFAAKDTWEFDKEHDPASLKGFSGPDDVNYRAAIKKEHEEGLVMSKERLKRVMAARP